MACAHSLKFSFKCVAPMRAWNFPSGTPKLSKSLVPETGAIRRRLLSLPFHSKCAPPGSPPTVRQHRFNCIKCSGSSDPRGCRHCRPTSMRESSLAQFESATPNVIAGGSASSSNSSRTVAFEKGNGLRPLANQRPDPASCQTRSSSPPLALRHFHALYLLYTRKVHERNCHSLTAIALAKVHSLWCWCALAPRGRYAGQCTKVPRHEDARWADRFILWHVEHKISMRVGQITKDNAKSRKTSPSFSLQSDVSLLLPASSSALLASSSRGSFKIEAREKGRHALSERRRRPKTTSRSRTRRGIGPPVRAHSTKHTRGAGISARDARHPEAAQESESEASESTVPSRRLSGPQRSAARRPTWLFAFPSRAQKGVRQTNSRQEVSHDRALWHLAFRTSRRVAAGVPVALTEHRRPPAPPCMLPSVGGRASFLCERQLTQRLAGAGPRLRALVAEGLTRSSRPNSLFREDAVPTPTLLRPPSCRARRCPVAALFALVATAHVST